MINNVNAGSCVDMEEITDNNDYIKMDYSLETPEERVQKVEEIISKTPPERLTSNYLEKLSDYIIFAMDKQEKKEKKILTENRKNTINKRELSFEGIVNYFENNENNGDTIYNMIANDKNIIFKHKFNITEEDLADIPQLKELKEEIEKLELKFKTVHGKKAYDIKSQIISMRQDQYVIKNAYKPKTINCINPIKNFKKLNLDEKIYIDENNQVQSTGFINFFTLSHVSALLTHYEKLYQENWANCNEDAKWMLEDFKELIDKTFQDNTIFAEIVYKKIYGYTNAEIQQILKDKYDFSYSIEYISYVWKNKIPKLIVNKAIDEWLIWHYTYNESGYWKRCSKCGKKKLGMERFFNKNKASKDGLYSICKECRSKSSLK